MSFPRYPSYKDSGVEWLGEVPGHWGVGQSRRLFALRNERALDTDKQLTASQAHGVIYQEDFIRLEGRRVVEVIKGADILKHVEPNDFVISMRSFQGGIEWCQVRGCISSAYVMLIPCDRIHAPFFQYLLKSQSYIQALQTTSNLVRDGQALRYDNFTQVDLPLIPLDEQTQIAAFLDRETAKIDELVAEQRRLMALLKEKRQAVISHAVTKGLNPHAPMKPSGIEWLGDVPAHWEVKRLKYVGKAFGGLIYDPSEIVEEGNGTLVLRSSNVQNGRIVFDDNVYVTTTIPEKIVTQNGDILVCSRNGSRTLIGKNAMIDDDSSGVTFGAFMMIFRSENNGYIFHVFNSQLFKFQSGAFLTATINQLTVSNLYSMEVPLPPVDEQQTIATFLNRENAQFDTLTAEAQRAIDLLQERRTALISAAVTGQIDVRPFVEREAA